MEDKKDPKETPLGIPVDDAWTMEDNYGFFLTVVEENGDVCRMTFVPDCVFCSIGFYKKNGLFEIKKRWVEKWV